MADENVFVTSELAEVAEAGVLEILRGEAGDFTLLVSRRGGLFVVKQHLRATGETHVGHGSSFASAWLDADVAPFHILDRGRE